MFSVTQIGNLLFRRLQIGRALAVFRPPGEGAVLQDAILRYGRLAICATNIIEALKHIRPSAVGGTIGMRPCVSTVIGLDLCRSMKKPRTRQSVRAKNPCRQAVP